MSLDTSCHHSLSHRIRWTQAGHKSKMSKSPMLSMPCWIVKDKHGWWEPEKLIIKVCSMRNPSLACKDTQPRNFSAQGDGCPLIMIMRTWQMRYMQVDETCLRVHFKIQSWNSLLMEAAMSLRGNKQQTMHRWGRIFTTSPRAEIQAMV